MGKSNPESQNRKEPETVSRDTGFLSGTFRFLLAGKNRKIYRNFPKLSGFKKEQASRKKPVLSLCKQESLGGTL